MYYLHWVLATSGEGCDGTHIPVVVRADGGPAGVPAVPAAHGLHARRPAGLCDLALHHPGPFGHYNLVVPKLTVRVQQLRPLILRHIGIRVTFVTYEFLGF